MSTPISTQMTNGLQRFAARHPFLSVLLLLVLFALVLFEIPPVLVSLGIVPTLATLGSEFLGVLLALFLLSMLHWWRETGFARGLTGKGVMLYIVPIVFIALPSLAQVVNGSIHLTAMKVLYIALLVLLVGLLEETLFRGLIMYTLLPKGVLFSAVVSSVVFALVHVLNLVGSWPPAYVVGQILVAFGFGLFLAALWLRTGSIWPLIFLHAIRDFGALVSISANPKSFSSIGYSGAIIAGSILSVLLIAYALFLLRPSQLSRLRAYYTPHLLHRPVPIAEGDGQPVASGSASHEDAPDSRNDAMPPQSI